jgi:RNA polymerase sigma-70 factor (TIGR02960 family)
VALQDLDELRRSKRQVPALESFRDVPWLQPYPDRLLDEIAPRDEEPDAVVVARETIELAYIAVMQALPGRQRAVLILRDVLEWPTAEAAELLDMSVPAANSALQRARATVAGLLPEERRGGDRSDLAQEEQTLLRGFIAAHEAGDAEASIAMVREDVRITMPPHPFLYEGREAIAPLMEAAFADEAMGEWRLVPTRANRLPTAASYLRAPGDAVFRAFKFDVIRVVDGAIAEITTFDATLFEAFGLPATLDA